MGNDMKIRLDQLRKIFVDSVRREFEYLESEYGYKCISSKAPFVVYESNKIFIEIYYETERGELDFGFGRLNREEERKQAYGLSDLSGLSDPMEVRKLSFVYTKKPDELKEKILIMANYLKQFTSLLIGDESFYESMAANRRST